MEQTDEALVSVAAAMLSGDMNPIEGARRLNSLRLVSRDPENAVFLPIRGSESETDDYPMGPAREHFATEYLARMDREIAEHVDRSRAELDEACRNIVREFSG